MGSICRSDLRVKHITDGVYRRQAHGNLPNPGPRRLLSPSNTSVRETVGYAAITRDPFLMYLCFLRGVTLRVNARSSRERHCTLRSSHDSVLGACENPLPGRRRGQSMPEGVSVPDELDGVRRAAVETLVTVRERSPPRSVCIRLTDRSRRSRRGCRPEAMVQDRLAPSDAIAAVALVAVETDSYRSRHGDGTDRNHRETSTLVLFVHECFRPGGSRTTGRRAHWFCSVSDGPDASKTLIRETSTLVLFGPDPGRCRSRRRARKTSTMVLSVPTVVGIEERRWPRTNTHA